MYLNKEGIYRSNGTTKMSRFSDHDKPIPWPLVERKTSPNQLLSAVSLDEYDCNERRVRILQTANYDGHMGNGMLVVGAGVKLTRLPSLADPSEPLQR